MVIYFNLRIFTQQFPRRSGIFEGDLKKQLKKEEKEKSEKRGWTADGLLHERRKQPSSLF